mgnify:CR=1 FL=1
MKRPERDKNQHDREIQNDNGFNDDQKCPSRPFASYYEYQNDNGFNDDQPSFSRQRVRLEFHDSNLVTFLWQLILFFLNDPSRAFECVVFFVVNL